MAEVEPKFIAWLKSNNAPGEVIAEAEKGFLRQQDYTRKTQELSEVEKQLAYYMGRSEGGGGSNGSSKPKGAVDEFLDGLRGTDFGDQVLPLLEGLSKATRADIERELGQQVSAVQRDVQGVRLNSQLERYLEESMVPQFGEGVRELWPEIRSEAERRLARGEHVVPENLLWSLNPERAHDLRSTTVASKREGDKAKHMEGLTKTSRREPPGSLSPSPSKESGAQERSGPPARIDWSVEAKNILAEIGAPSE